MYLQNRQKELKTLHATGLPSYPVHVQSVSIASFVESYNYLNSGEDLSVEHECVLQGRIQSIRSLGKMLFITLSQEEEKVQLKVTNTDVAVREACCFRVAVDPSRLTVLLQPSEEVTL